MLENSSEKNGETASLTASLAKKVNAAKKESIIHENTEELTTTAEAIIRKYFDIGAQNTLDNMKVLFTTKQDNRYIYLISINDLRDKIKYELLYQYNEDTATWQIVRETQ